MDAIGIPISPRIDHNVGTPLPRSFVMKVDPIVLLQAHHYVLENTTIMQPYIKDHQFLFYSFFFFGRNLQY